MKKQNVEKLSLDLILVDNFCQNIKSFCKQNSVLQIHSLPDRIWKKLTVCIGDTTILDLAFSEAASILPVLSADYLN